MMQNRYFYLIEDQSFVDFCLETDSKSIDQWNQWLAQNPEARPEVMELKTLLQSMGPAVGKQIAAQHFEQLKTRIQTRPPQTRSLGMTWRRYVAAAAIVLIGGFSVWFYINHMQIPPLENQIAGQYTPLVEPGQNKAYLVLPDGRKMELSSDQQGIVMQGGIQYLDGSAIWESDLAAADQMLEITTPFGGQYRVDLEDGSKIWLNSGSTLRYPAKFAQSERKVELIGEGYFEVNPSDHPRPFVVESKGQAIEVLGTKFNVHAYAEDDFINSALVEGKVRLQTDFGESILLMPNQQGRIDLKAQTMKISEVNAQEIVSWKDGYFYFEDTEFVTAMATLARWYDVEIVLDTIPNKRLNGVLPRNLRLHDLIAMLSETTNLKLEIQEIEKQPGQTKKRRVHMRY